VLVSVTGLFDLPWKWSLFFFFPRITAEFLIINQRIDREKSPRKNTHSAEMAAPSSYPVHGMIHRRPGASLPAVVGAEKKRQIPGNKLPAI
jgi:hypothetical protein